MTWRMRYPRPRYPRGGSLGRIIRRPVKRRDGADESGSVPFGLQQPWHHMALIAANTLGALVQRDVGVLEMPESAGLQAPPLHIGGVGCTQ